MERGSAPHKVSSVNVSWWRRSWWLLRRSLMTVYEDGGLGISKGAAYSALLSFFPVLTTVALILVQVKAEQAADVISRFLFEVVPPGTKELVMHQFTVHGEKPESLLVLAALVSVWAASGLILSLIDGFNAVYRVPRGRSLVKGRLVAMMLVFIAVLPGLGAASLIMFGTRAELWLVTTLGVIAHGEQVAGGVFLFGIVVRYGVALSATVLTMLLLYKFGPNRRQRWPNLWPGALIATFLWLSATLVFSWYVRNIADYNVLYGSIGAVIALILWMYLLAVITLAGCAFNAERERLETAANSVTQ